MKEIDRKTRRIETAVFVTALWCAATMALAADETPASTGVIVEFLRDPVVLYADPDRSSASSTVAKTQLTLPLAVVDEDGDFFKVRTKDGERWVSAMSVRLDRRSVSCAAQKNTVASRDYAASRGAGEKCK